MIRKFVEACGKPELDDSWTTRELLKLVYLAEWSVRNSDDYKTDRCAAAVEELECARQLLAKRALTEPVISVEQYISIISQPCVFCGEKSGNLDCWDGILGFEFENCRAICSGASSMSAPASFPID